MTAKPETRLQRRIRRALEKEVGGWWAKIYTGPFQEAGIPDLLGCVAGMFFALEVKMPGEEPSAIQVKTMRDIRKDGGAIARVVTSPEQAVRVVLNALSRTEKGRSFLAAKSRDLSVLRSRNREDARVPERDRGGGTGRRFKLPGNRRLSKD